MLQRLKDRIFGDKGSQNPEDIEQANQFLSVEASLSKAKSLSEDLLRTEALNDRQREEVLSGYYLNIHNNLNSLFNSRPDAFKNREKLLRSISQVCQKYSAAGGREILSTVQQIAREHNFIDLENSITGFLMRTDMSKYYGKKPREEGDNS